MRTPTKFAEGHTWMGYNRDDEYRCECGAFMGKGLKEVASPGTTSLRDQWDAHVKEQIAKGAKALS